MYKIVKTIYLFTVLFLSKLFNLNGLNTCRFTPSCSVFAQEAIAKHGVFKSATLILKRFFKCNPWGEHGFDPVP